MIGHIILFVIGYYVLDYFTIFYKKERELCEYIEFLENKADIKILCAIDTSYKFYLLTLLDKYVINIDEEEKHGKFCKRLHKLSGHLLLIINFNKLDQNKLSQITKSLTSYTNLPGNTLSTYVPYKTKDSGSLLALIGKTIILGNYAVVTNTKIDQSILKVLETYYSSTNYKKILEGFYSEQNANLCYSTEDLLKMKLNVINEEKIKDKITKCTKDDFKTLMEKLDDFFK